MVFQQIKFVWISSGGQNRNTEGQDSVYELDIITPIAGGESEGIVNNQQNSTTSQSKVVENNTPPPPVFSKEHTLLVIESWPYVENHVTEVIQITPLKYYSNS